MAKELRYYQIEARDAVHKALDKNVKDQMLVMATGCGKTFTAANITKDFKKCLWLTHTEELIEQSAIALLLSEYTEDLNQLQTTMRTFPGFWSFMDTITNQIKNPLFGNPNLLNIDYEQIYKLTGIIKREKLDLHTKITVASIQTLHRRLDKIDPKHFDIIVVDECHMAAAPTWEKSIRHFDYELNLGLTATPFRADGMPLSNIFDETIYEYDILRGINDGFLCELDAVAIKTHINLDSVRTVGGEFNQKDLAIVNNPQRNKLIVDKYQEYCDGRPFIAFCVDVRHAIDLCEAFNSRGIRTSFVVGDEELCPDRKDRIRAFKNDQFRGLTNCMVLTAGFDHPEVAAVIMACPTKSKTKFIQCVGRGTRLKKNFKDCIILDCVDSTSRHRLVNCEELDADADIENKVFLTKDKKDKQLKIREERIRKLESQREKDDKVDLFQIPRVTISNSPAMKEDATEAQLQWVKRLGYDIESIKYTKGMCSEIISMQPASEKQKWALRKMGFNVHDSLTIGEANAAFADHNKRNGIVPEWKKKALKPFSDLE